MTHAYSLAVLMRLGSPYNSTPVRIYILCRIIPHLFRSSNVLMSESDEWPHTCLCRRLMMRQISGQLVLFTFPRKACSVSSAARKAGLCDAFEVDTPAAINLDRLTWLWWSYWYIWIKSVGDVTGRWAAHRSMYSKLHFLVILRPTIQWYDPRTTK